MAQGLEGKASGLRDCYLEMWSRTSRNTEMIAGYSFVVPIIAGDEIHFEPLGQVLCTIAYICLALSLMYVRGQSWSRRYAMMDPGINPDTQPYQVTRVQSVDV